MSKDSEPVSPADTPLRSGRDLDALAEDFGKLVAETFWLGTELAEADDFPERAALAAMVSQANRMLNCAALVCRHPGRWDGTDLYREQIAADYWKSDDA